MIHAMEEEQTMLDVAISRSEDDDPDEDEDYDDDDDDDDDEEVMSWWDDIRSSWRLHCGAILIAVLATGLAHLFPQYWMISSSSSSMMTWNRPPPPAGRILSSWLSRQPARHHDHHEPHQFLERFARTANVSFCGATDQTFVSSEFGTMDFHIPNDLIPTMEWHLEIDSLPDDIVRTDTAADTGNADRNYQIRCLLQLKEDSPQGFIKGVTYFYKRPSIDTMYRSLPDHHQPEVATNDMSPRTKDSARITETVLTFTGFAAKFVNLGPTPILLYWDGRGGDDRNRRLVGEIAPFEAMTTATSRPGESFSVSPVYDHSFALDRWTVTADDAVQYYEPYRKTPLNEQEQALYSSQKLNQEFAKHYLIHSGRTWLSHFPRAFPIHFMWKADYFGQRHEVEAILDNAESHIDEEPQTFTLEVASVSPRVFKIPNFLSPVECNTLIQVAIQNGLKASTVYAGGDDYGATHHRDAKTRSSTNTWLTRDHHINLTDTIYRRAAHLMKIDDASFGHKAPIDDSVDDAKYHSIAESLQVVRYKVGEEYSPHHDWVLPSQRNRYQPTRFATLLIYLNDDFEGGRTLFPRAVNRQYHEGVQIAPQKGTAILFYNLLPDGNVDDLSQHGSEKVTKGEKVSFKITDV